MTKTELNEQYEEWMCQLVDNKSYLRRRSYRTLLTYLHNSKFVYILKMDSNRAEDGRSLRFRFGYEHDYSDTTIATYLDDRECSILEMMIALAVRCEEHIMDNPDIGDRTGRWFWGMINNLGLEGMCDRYFDEDYVRTVLMRLLKRKYSRNGEGGLFTVERCKHDLRDVEIWYQMCWYLEGVI